MAEQRQRKRTRSRDGGRRHQRQGPLPARQGPRRDHRRRQLRELVRAGRPPLRGRRPEAGRPGPHARRPRRLPRHRTSSSRAPSTSTRRRSARTSARRSGPTRTTRSSSRRCRAKLGVARLPRHDARRHRQVRRREDHQGPRRDRRHRLDPQGDAHRRRRLLPAGRLRAGDEVVRRADPRGRLRLRELHPGLHRPRGLLEQALQEGRAADRRRRHQVAGRRDDRAPHARPPVPRARREDAAHLAAERRRQHGLLQHARARAPGVQEDLQDATP